MGSTRWTDTLSDRMRREGDFEADGCVAALEATAGDAAANVVLSALSRNNSRLPEDTPEPLRRFLDEAVRLPAWVDPERLKRGEAVYLDNGLAIALVLLCKAIPEGYGAPCLTQILHMTGLLEKETYRRLLGVLQMVLDVSVQGGFAPGGKAVLIAAKLRLLHAGMRRITRKKLPGYDAEHGVPCNHEDMLATLMGFSLLVIDGLHLVGSDLPSDDAEALFYPWRVFAVCMGIPEDYVPLNLDDARAFYDAFKQRQYKPAQQNREGVLLAQANLEMLQGLLPPWTRRTALRHLPAIYMYDFMGHEAAERVGIAPVPGHKALKQLALYFVRESADTRTSSPLRRVMKPVHMAVSRRLFQTLILEQYHGIPQVIVPHAARDLWAI